MTAPTVSFAEQLQAAACAAVSSDPYQKVLLGWLRTASAHLAEMGLTCAEPGVTHVGKMMSAGVFTSAACRVIDPLTGNIFQLEAVLHAYTTDATFGHTSASLEAYFVKNDGAGKSLSVNSLVRQELFSTEALDPPIRPGRDDAALLKFILTRIDRALKETLRSGFDPSLQQFRLALEEKLAP